MQDKSDVEVIVKYSSCQKCGGWVRAASSEYLSGNIKARNEFMKEVLQHDLNVNSISLSGWQKLKIDHCKCK